MPIIRNLKKDFDEGRMDNLRSLSYEDRGAKAPYVEKQYESKSNPVSKRVDDASRIAKMLIDKPGIKHLANEALLKQGELTKKFESNEKYQQGTLVGNLIRRAGGTVKHVAQIVGSTLAQVPVNGTGTHFLRGFKTDTYLQDGDPSGGFLEFFGAGGVEGTKYSSRGQRVPAEGVLNGSKLPSRNTTASPGELGQMHIGVEGDVSVNTDIAKYNSTLTYTGNDTNENIANVVGGAHINKSEILASNTTASPGDLGTSIELANTSGSLTSEVKEAKYNAQKSYTETDTESNATNVNSGQSIPKPPNLTRNTTPSPGSLGIDKKDIEGTVTENVTTSTYRTDVPYTETTTVDNITNANVGAPIKNPTGTGEFDQTFAVQTTSLEGEFGISNKKIEGDTAPLENRKADKFQIGDTKSKFDTQKNIIAAQFFNSGSGVNIPLKESPTPDEFVDNQMSKQLYSSGSTYTGKTAKQHIDILKHGDGVNAGIVNRVNHSLDTVGKTSNPIPDSLDTESATYNQLISSTKVKDFRETDEFGGGNKNTYSFDYSDTDVNKEQRVGLGNPGKITRNRTFYNIKDSDTVDKINKLDVAKSPLDGTNVNEGGNRDLIQLEFQIITPDQKYYLAFRAFLDTFDDSFNGSWNANKYLGRADSFYTYSGFERSINIGFKIAAQSQEEMKPLYQKAATLASVTAPTYGDNGRFMRGSIAKVTVGDYIYEQPGIIESVQYTWQKDYPWEISFQGPELKDKEGPQILPHVLDVSVSFKVIHDFLPQTGINPFISNHNVVKTIKDTYIPLV